MLYFLAKVQIPGAAVDNINDPRHLFDLLPCGYPWCHKLMT